MEADAECVQLGKDSNDWGYTAGRTERSILNDLRGYPFTEDIKNTADAIYNKMIYRVRRGKIRNQMLFYCVYCAHLELKRDVDPIELGGHFGLNQGQIQRCDSMFSFLQTGYKPASTNISPLRYLTSYCKNMQLSEEIYDEVLKFASNILSKDKSLLQENPQTVAAGILRYYMVSNGIITEDTNKMKKVTSRSNVTIDNIFKKIVAIDNK